MEFRTGEYHVERNDSDKYQLEYIQYFAQNTVLSETCAIDPEGILSILMDIEQMTWRQFCLIEGFSKEHCDKIEIMGMDFSGLNAVKSE